VGSLCAEATLLLGRQVEELAAEAGHPIDRLLVDAVSDDDQEADLLAGAADLRSNPGRIAAHVDDGDAGHAHAE